MVILILHDLKQFFLLTLLGFLINENALQFLSAGAESPGSDIPDVAAMDTQMKKYEKCFTTSESEKKALKKKNEDLTEELKKSQKESTLKKIQEARLQSDYRQVKAILERIHALMIRKVHAIIKRENSVQTHAEKMIFNVGII